MTPGHLQSQLAAYYELSLPLDVEAVLTSDPRWLDALLPPQARRPPEQLLLRQDGDVLDVALFLAADVLAAMRRDDPRHGLHERNLPSFLHALEGVSHFVCLSWHAQHDRAICALELELQAEIDKFLGCLALSAGGEADVLLTRLFDRIRFDAGLDAEERQRYRTANRLAARYCQDLLRRHGDRLHEGAGQRELRRFYRFDRNAKLAFIG